MKKIELKLSCDTVPLSLSYSPSVKATAVFTFKITIGNGGYC
jgi:hypothetical protein